MKAHVNSPLCKFLTPDDNKAGFRNLVLEFLAECGHTYWVRYSRDYLQEPDIWKGFYYPRDAERKCSR